MEFLAYLQESIWGHHTRYHVRRWFWWYVLTMPTSNFYAVKMPQLYIKQTVRLCDIYSTFTQGKQRNRGNVGTVHSHCHKSAQNYYKRDQYNKQRIVVNVRSYVVICMPCRRVMQGYMIVRRSSCCLNEVIFDFGSTHTNTTLYREAT